MKYTKEKIEEIFLASKSKKDLYKAFNIPLNLNLINLDTLLLVYLEYLGFNNREDISSINLNKERDNRLKLIYFKNPNICPNCGKIISYEKRNNKYCSLSCATADTNKKRGERTEETKNKIKLTLLKRGQSRKQNPLYKKYRICCVCKKEFEVQRIKNGTLSQSKTCSENCHKLLIKLNGIKSAAKIIAEGRHKGWQSRNIISYAEKFWIQVLDNNNIPYIREYHLNNMYFLDFFILKNEILLDLEIDGKQHTYPDRIIHDQIRDAYLKLNGYIVYRIPWHYMHGNKKQSDEMKEKIDTFLEFYNKL